MDYEKKYREAIERAKNFIENGDERERTIAESIFAGLMEESEDERIRNFLIDFIKVCGWTEKKNQGWPLREECIAWLEKQGEQKSWSEEDEKFTHGLIRGLTAKRDIHGHTTFSSDCIEITETINWLQSIKDRVQPQPKQECSVRDRILQESSISYLCNLRDIFETKGWKKEHIQRCINWLESLKPQNRWKPSEQKSADEIKPKFKVGDWVRAISSGNIFKILSVNDGLYRVLCYDGVEANYPIEEVEKDLAYWTIQDAKNGDVLYCENCGIEYIVMNKGVNENGNVDSYFRYNSMAGFGIDVPSVLCANGDTITPATKEQRDFLFKKMHEAGYKWDAEKKELKKIEQKTEENKGNLGGISSNWSEEDEMFLFNITKDLEKLEKESKIEQLKDVYSKEISWFKSIKDRVQPKQEWSEEDKIALDDALWCCKQAASIAKDENDMGNIWYAENWLKSLKPQKYWMPSEEEIIALTEVAFINESAVGKERKKVLEELIEKLKTLRDYE